MIRFNTCICIICIYIYCWEVKFIHLVMDSLRAIHFELLDIKVLIILRI